MSHRTFYAATQTAPKAMRPQKIAAQTPPQIMRRDDFFVVSPCIKPEPAMNFSLSHTHTTKWEYNGYFGSTNYKLNTSDNSPVSVSISTRELGDFLCRIASKHSQ